MYHVLRDQTNLLGDYSCIGAKCWLCDENTHQPQNCPQTHFVVDKQAVIERHIQNQKDFATRFQRKSRNKFHALTRKPHMATAIERIHTLKNQITTSLTDASGTMNNVQKSKKQTTIPPEELENDSLNNSDIIDAIYETLARIKDEETGVVRLVKPKRSTQAFENPSKFELSRSATMKQNGEAIFIPMKVKIQDKNRKKIDEVEIDQVRNYEIYFPHNNINKVIEQFENGKRQKRATRFNLSTEQDVMYFKMKLGKIFEKSRKRTGTIDSINSGTPSMSPTPIAKGKTSIMSSSKRGIVIPYVRQRSRSVKDDIVEAVTLTKKKSNAVRTSSWSGA